jgi:hypothetical protein
MPITGRGWELLVKRLGTQTHARVTRTYASYQVHRDGVADAALFGHLCECKGPGDNVHSRATRIKEGRYPLSTHFGRKYKTIGFSTDTHRPAVQPMPGLLLLSTGNRTAILIHPGHPPKLYLSSIGCLNPSKPLGKDDDMDFFESRTRVLALIDSLRAFSPAAFQHNRPTPIPDAAVVIDGEPMNPFVDPPPAGPPLIS